MIFSGKTYWIVGASEGLGRALSSALSAEGVHLVLSARNEARLTELSDSLPNATALPFDVSNRASVGWATHRLKEIGTQVDGIIYCAGAYDPMTAQNWDATAAEVVADVNFMGALRVLAHVVPQMAERDTGHIVLIGSLAGFRGLPGAIGYGASKAALMHLGENLRADLRSTGVKVQCLNPGFIQTRLTDKNAFDMPMLMSPEDAANHCMQAMRSNRFSTSFPAPFSWLFLMGRYLPIGLFQSIFRRKS
ncbi:SDR family NAD(P)-dependent oxidoreductase [Shimia abyssi]|uniref:Short-subunit dehydrogenase n=1 Tax=Shimia abyssi TaxID=1662395 RepID=A0A2P8FIU4_9RHOB|nr:SDR family NAD(P)-dependent oxidoreductase [Shimia abyssi]PSL21635.1 short-subunit dehydrogenase [Shimia abyssi]